MSQVPSAAARAAAVFATHPMPRCERVCAQLRAAGLPAHALPSFALRPVDPQGLASAAAQASAYDWLVFVSPTAIELFAEALGAHGWPPSARLAVVGAGSRAALHEAGVEPSQPILVPSGGHDAQALLAEPAMATVDGQRVLLVRGASGRDELTRTLRGRGARVEELRAYERCETGWPAASAEAVDHARRTAAPARFVFTMADAGAATRRTLQQRSDAHWSWAREQRALAIHPRIAQRLAEQGWRDVRTVDAGLDRLVAALESS